MVFTKGVYDKNQRNEKKMSEQTSDCDETQTKKDWRAEKPLSISLVDDGDSELIER